MNSAAANAQSGDDRERGAESPLPGWPSFGADEQAAVSAVLSSGKVNYWTGEHAREFEREYAAELGVRHSIALMNGTVALELALRQWEIGQGDEVIVTPRTFIASVSCVVLQGARPVFADVDRDSGNLTAAAIERVLSPRTKAIIPVHLGGWPCEMDEIMALADAHGLKVLEDCAQAHGAEYRGRRVGGIGHAGAFSFCQDKIITTGGEGGLLATDDEQLWERAWAFKDHGKRFDTVYNRNHPPGFRWLHETFGTNLRMTEIQAVLGRLQLKKLDHWVGVRRANAEAFHAALASIPSIRIPWPPTHVRNSYYRFYFYVNPRALRASWSRDRIVAEVAAAGVPCFTGSCSEVYLETAFQGTGIAPGQHLPVARELGETSVALLVHPTLGREHLAWASDVVRRVVTRAVV